MLPTDIGNTDGSTEISSASIPFAGAELRPRSGMAVVGEEEIVTGPGRVVYTPPGVSHQFFNTGDTPVRLFWMYSPSGAERDVIEAEFT